MTWLAKQASQSLKQMCITPTSVGSAEKSILSCPEKASLVSNCVSSWPFLSIFFLLACCPLAVLQHAAHRRGRFQGLWLWNLTSISCHRHRKFKASFVYRRKIPQSHLSMISLQWGKWRRDEIVSVVRLWLSLPTPLGSVSSVQHVCFLDERSLWKESSTIWGCHFRLLFSKGTRRKELSSCKTGYDIFDNKVI